MPWHIARILTLPKWQPLAIAKRAAIVENWAAHGREAVPAATLRGSTADTTNRRLPSSLDIRSGDFPSKESLCHQRYSPYVIKPFNCNAAAAGIAASRCGANRPPSCQMSMSARHRGCDARPSTLSQKATEGSTNYATWWPHALIATIRGTNARTRQSRSRTYRLFASASA